MGVRAANQGGRLGVKGKAKVIGVDYYQLMLKPGTIIKCPACKHKQKLDDFDFDPTLRDHIARGNAGVRCEGCGKDWQIRCDLGCAVMIKAGG